MYKIIVYDTMTLTIEKKEMEQMKKKSFLYIIICIVILLLAAIIIGPILWWNSKSESPLKVWIIDKTVPTQTYREHMGLMWILNHNKVTNEKTNDYFQY